MNRLLCLLLAAFLSVAALAKPAQSADAVVTTMTEQVLAQGALTDAVSIKALVESAVMPHVDFRAMTARAVGPRWRTANEDQRARLMAGFEALLIRTYAGALSEAGGARFRLKRSAAVDASTTEVWSDVTVRGGREPIALNYRLALQDDRWKIVDVSVLGVWMVATYQTQFARVMERSGGIDGLIQELEARSKAP